MTLKVTFKSGINLKDTNGIKNLKINFKPFSNILEDTLGLYCVKNKIQKIILVEFLIYIINLLIIQIDKEYTKKSKYKWGKIGVMA